MSIRILTWVSFLILFFYNFLHFKMRYMPQRRAENSGSNSEDFIAHFTPLHKLRFWRRGKGLQKSDRPAPYYWLNQNLCCQNKIKTNQKDGVEVFIPLEMVFMVIYICQFLTCSYIFTYRKLLLHVHINKKLIRKA